MSDHISKSLMEQFRDRSLDASTLCNISAHLESCAECYELFHEAFRDKRASASARFSLSSQGWLRDEHLEYEQIVSCVDGNLDQEDRKILDEHLELCSRCREDVQSFAAHRQQIEPELKIRYAPAEKRAMVRRFADWWENFKLLPKPAYAISALLLISLLVLATTLLRRGSSTETSSQPATPIVTVSPTHTPTQSTVTTQLYSGPDKSRGEAGNPPPSNRNSPAATDHTNRHNSERPVISLRDGGRQIFLSETGNIMGLDDLSVSTRQLVKETLSSGELQRPAILNDLVAETSATRSNTADQPSFRLISPRQTVIIETRPVFKWELLKGALGYKVHIASRANWAGTSSPALAPSMLEWSPSTPLRRGETYTWVVSAITDKGELTIPPSSEPERKFKVLGERDFDALMKLKRQTGSHLVLGLFYARTGLVFDAERELQILANENADSALAGKLLDQVRSWR
jgi:predicted anti-sigma-YlaC factor YlaD